MSMMWLPSVKPQPQPEPPDEPQLRYITIESDGYKTTVTDDQGRKIITQSVRLDIEPTVVRAEIEIVAPRLHMAGLKPSFRHVCKECGLDHPCAAP